VPGIIIEPRGEPGPPPIGECLYPSTATRVREGAEAAAAYDAAIALIENTAERDLLWRKRQAIGGA